ncbi:hypothetical protein ABTA48_07830 [Acinetobacter baumannii]
MNKTKGCLIANFATVPFAVRIAAMLQDAEKFKELLPLLRKLGFQ